MRTILSALPLALATLVGCAVSPNGDPSAEGVADAEAGTKATAVVVVERTVSASGSGANAGAGTENVRAEAVARFVRMRSGAVDDDALRMVGAATDFPALGSCSQLSSLQTTSIASGASSAPVRAVSLVDVGTITIESAGLKTTLSPRQLPDVADIVSGVVYTARPGDAALPARGSYILRAAGSDASTVAPFTVSAIAPAEPSEIRIAGQDVRAANGIALATVAPSAPVEVTWEPGESGASDDVIYFDISGSAATSGSAVVTVPTTRCLFSDVGHATLPANVLGAIDDGTVSIHRLHREAIHARGVDPGEMRFDFARVVAISRH